MTTETRTLFLVDGTSQLFRAYFALPGLTSPSGVPTGAVFGFTTMLRKLIKEEGADYLAVAFDLPGKVFRHETYGDYKANRPPTPEDLHVQAPYVKEVCELLGVHVVEREGYEADDLIATYARLGRDAGFEVVVVASDKDLLQLVDTGVRVLNPAKNVYFDPGTVEQKIGVSPDRVLDVQGLMGDSVDNIPGVPGIGLKTAVSVVTSYGNLEAVIARAARFVALFDARDALLTAIDTLAKTESVEQAAAKRVVQGRSELAGALEALIEIEADPELRVRLEALAVALDGIDPIPTGGPGKSAAKPLRPLVREMKAMDRGSSRRVWYAIHENADQARMSKELATLHDAVPVTVDPKAFARNETNRPRALAFFRSLGFKALVEELEANGEPGPDKASAADGEAPGGKTVLTREGLEEVAADCRAAGRFALQVLGDGGTPMQARPVGLALAHEGGQACYVPLAHDYLGAPAQVDPATLRSVLGPLLADPGVAKVAHDLKLATHILERYGLPVCGWDLDTMVAAFLLDSSRTSYALENVTEEHLGRATTPYSEVGGSGTKQVPANEIEVERVAAYAAEAGEAVRRLAAALGPRLAERGLDELYESIDGPLLPLLKTMEAAGIRVDVDLLGRMSEEMETALDTARSAIHQLAGSEFNVDSPKQLREVLFDRLGLKPRRKTAKSKVASTDAQTLEELAGEYEIAGRILEYRELAKLKGTYVDALPRLVDAETGRVHTSYNPTGAATGRLSSSDPNLQNIPVRKEAGRRIRSAFVPEEGWLFLASDYSQVELRVLAHLSGDEELTAAFNAGEDIHRYTASRVFGVVSDLVTDTMRRRAKAVNFGILYGMSEVRLAREQGMSRGEAREFIKAYFERFASVRGYIDEVRERALRDAAVRTLFGRVRYFPQLHRRVNRGLQEQAYRAAVNTTVQGTAADLMKLAMLRVAAALEGADLGARMLLQVHDELLLEVPSAEIEPARRLVREAMEHVHPLTVPLVVDQKVGSSWLEVT